MNGDNILVYCFADDTLLMFAANWPLELEEKSRAITDRVIQFLGARALTLVECYEDRDPDLRSTEKKLSSRIETPDAEVTHLSCTWECTWIRSRNGTPI